MHVSKKGDRRVAVSGASKALVSPRQEHQESRSRACLDGSRNVDDGGSERNRFRRHGSRSVKQNVPFANRLPQIDRQELQGHIQVFLAEKYFEGCGGLEVTEEIKVTIAAWACLLLLHRDTNYYPRLITILVYPNAYIARNLEHKGGGVVEEEEAVRIGEAWMDGVAVISWDDVCRSAVGVETSPTLCFTSLPICSISRTAWPMEPRG